jgi:iron complex outermembrane receptor protein
MHNLKSTVSLITISLGLLAPAAHAQTAEAQATTDTQASANASDGSGIADIVVTAQRRSESVQKSSLAISVVGGEELVRQGVANARDLQTVAPAVSINQQGAYVQTNIRGAGDFASNALAQLAVSYSIDGVVIGQGSQIGGNFYDLARVEVLKGPQGTLYGRNATGGAINLISNRPTHKFEGNLTAEYGNYDAKRLTGAINVPVSDSLAVRAAFNLVDRDGFLSDGTDDDKRQAFRLQALWDIAPDVSLRLFGDYAHTGGNGGGAVLWPRQPGTGKWTSYTDPRNVAALAAGTTVTLPGLGTFALQGPITPNSFVDNTSWSLSAEFNARLGDFATLTVVPAYRHQKISSNAYTTGFLLALRDNKDEQKSLEVRLSNESEKLKWVLGGFYFDDDSAIFYDTFSVSDISTLVFQRFNTSYNFPSYRNKSLAAFGEATYSVNDGLRVIGGLRYTEDKVSINGRYEDNSLPPATQPDFILDNRRKFSAVSWRGGVEYDVAPSSMLFLTASKGTKSGGFYAASPVDNSYRPENLTAFTLGSRNRFLDNTLQVNLELFYWKYRNQQLSAVGFTTDANIAYITRNAGASDPRGAEMDVVWQPTKADTLSINLSYNRAKFKKFDLSFPAPLIDALRVGSDCQVPAAPTLLGGLPVYSVNCAGAPVPRTPEFSGSVNYRHVFDLTNGGNVAIGGGGTFATSRFLTSDFFTPETKDKGYVLLNADLSYTSPDDRYTISAFVRNITNNAVYQGAFSNVLNGFPNLLGTPGTPNFVARNIGAPRTYGIRASFNF